tara:strand:+ start:1442 stop:2095 length:654 start_codon:yes stop_codon:yes gene_type:complete
LELFAGSRSFTKVAKELGCNTFCTDVNDFEGIDLVDDIMNIKPNRIPFEPEIIWASPPCTSFSVASISTYWKGGKGAYIPKKAESYIGLAYVQKAKDLIDYFKPKYYYIENPRGVLRKLDVVQDLPIRHTIWYCQYGDSRAKPTDIWTNDDSWIPRPVCKNGNPDCHHESAPRGSKTGTQGLKGNYERSMIPSGLFYDIFKNKIFSVGPKAKGSSPI